MIAELNLELRSGKLLGKDWLWPADDVTTWRFLNKEIHKFEEIEYRAASLPNEISALLSTEERNLVIQAGGNSGLYPKLYSKQFKKVITFEPDTRWFACLCYNAPETNIFKFQSCLGNSFTNLGLAPNLEVTGGDKNLGALQTQQSGNIPQITIDSLNQDPDLIHLDIEGYEGFALEGAVETIKRAKPMIVLETNNLGESYGYSDDKIFNLLESLDYKIVYDWHHDKAFKHKSKIM
jgi:FkbM family methyltransferase